MHIYEKEWLTLESHILELLKDGKRSNHPDFQILMRLYGAQYITEIAKRLLLEERQKEQDERTRKSD